MNKAIFLSKLFLDAIRDSYKVYKYFDLKKYNNTFILVKIFFIRFFFSFSALRNSIKTKKSSNELYLNTYHFSANKISTQEIVNEMNSLGTSRSDNLRYDELKITREELYKECVPILKDLIAISNDIEAIRTLMNIYGTLGDNPGFMEMKNLLDQLQ